MVAVRRVRRVIRKFDPWTVLKVALVLHLVGALAVLIGLLIFWQLLQRVGIPEALDDFLALISLIDEEAEFFNNGQRFRQVAIYAAVAVGVGMTLLSTLAAVFYNLASDVVGGVEVVMLEEILQVPSAPVPAEFVEADPAAPSSDEADLPTLAH